MDYSRRAGADLRTLPMRWAAYRAGDASAFASYGKLPSWSREAGDDVANLWECLLQFLARGGFLDRCGDDVPCTATDSSQFHSRHTSKFLKTCSRPWDQMQIAERKQCFRNYLHKKFSTDPRRASIRPPPRKKPRQADVKWGKFHLEEHEFDQLIEDSFGAYCACTGLYITA